MSCRGSCAPPSAARPSPSARERSGFVAVTATILSRGSGRWWLPLIPAWLDLAENVLIAALLDQDVTEAMAQLLYVVAISKFAAYRVVGGMVLVRLFRRRPPV